jgi:UTP--glucose-1-phosphate uridylyltransferase
VLPPDRHHRRSSTSEQATASEGRDRLRRCRRFDVDGDVTFGTGVIAVGDVRVTGPGHVPDGEVLGG